MSQKKYKYENFLDCSLTSYQRSLVQNLDKPLSIDEVREQFPIRPIIIRVISGYALILKSSNRIAVADFSSFLGPVSMNVSYGRPGRQTLFKRNWLAEEVQKNVYRVVVSK